MLALIPYLNGASLAKRICTMPSHPYTSAHTATDFEWHPSWCSPSDYCNIPHRMGATHLSGFHQVNSDREQGAGELFNARIRAAGYVEEPGEFDVRGTLFRITNEECDESVELFMSVGRARALGHWLTKMADMIDDLYDGKIDSL